MDATLVHKKVRGLKTLALFYIDGEFITTGAFTDKFDRLSMLHPKQLVGIYTRRASVMQIFEDMAYVMQETP